MVLQPFPHDMLPASSKRESPAAAVGRIHFAITLYFSSSNPECCVLGQSFTAAQGTISTLLFTAQS